MADLGVFSIALPEDLGGAGGTVADVAVVAEQLAVALAPGPLLPTLLAGLVLARSGRPEGDVLALLTEIAAGEEAVAVALTADGVSGTAAGTAACGSAAPRGSCSARATPAGCCSRRNPATPRRGS